jgi:hypothetical protein
MSPLPSRSLLPAAVSSLSLLVSACASYRTPGAGVDIADISGDDAQDIGELMRREPAARFPARVALVRAQSPGYRARGGGKASSRNRRPQPV